MEKKTDWKAVSVAGVVTFLSAVEHTVVTMSEWPYMHTIDPEATSQFFGFASSASKFGHAIFAAVFALWTYKIQNTKMPLIVGRLIAFFSCCLYLSVELLPVGRRYLMMFCYFLLGIATSSSTILRSYFAAVSTEHDRTKAFSAFVVANMLSILVGPICQLIFSFIRYPGFVVVEGFLKFHIYSAPIWIATFTNFVSKPELFCLEMGDLFNTENVKAWIKRMLSTNLKWPLIILCWLERMLIIWSFLFKMDFFRSVFSPFVMTAYGWDGQKTVHVISMGMVVIGILAIIVSVAFIVFRLGNTISPRCTFLIASRAVFLLFPKQYSSQFVFFSLFYSIHAHSNYPLFISGSETLGTGCDTRQFTWCGTAYGTLPIVLLIPVCLMLGVGVSMAAISLDTTYSKVLGKIDQVCSKKRRFSELICFRSSLSSPKILNRYQCASFLKKGNILRNEMIHNRVVDTSAKQ
ncbi:unnamed protein product [Angiostrongylus costaricensis]|uniref:MFS domain-containing protein n=1 Tax=Angiostrongylus costaricensis TaxID=334426 RepID=A0A158PDC4_ANGCS|nr:unnamed protein product [Angiostrongylus costaricensis]